jgi:hypothetical protein
VRGARSKDGSLAEAYSIAASLARRFFEAPSSVVDLHDLRSGFEEIRV